MLGVPPKELLILELIADGDDDVYGLDLVHRSGGRLKRGTVYVTLGRMEEKGLVRTRTVDPPEGSGGLPRRLYTLTALGRHALKSAREWSTLSKRLTPAVAR